MVRTSDPAKLRAVLLDFDGVVVDSMPIQEDAWRAAVRTVLGGGELEDPFVKNLHAGNAGPRMFEGIELEPAVEASLRREKDRIWFAQRKAVSLIPGAGEGIRSLSESVTLGMATSAPREYVESVLSRERLLGLFGCVLTDADVERPKPYPDLVDSLLEFLEMDPMETVMVGDTRTDLRMATAAGVPFVGYGHGDWPKGVARARDWEGLGHELRRRAAL